MMRLLMQENVRNLPVTKECRCLCEIGRAGDTYRIFVIAGANVLGLGGGRNGAMFFHSTQMSGELDWVI